MIIKAYEHQKIKKLNNKIFLFYGENDGYKNQVIKDVFIDDFKGNIERFDEIEILSNFFATLCLGILTAIVFFPALAILEIFDFGFLFNTNVISSWPGRKTKISPIFYV